MGLRKRGIIVDGYKYGFVGGVGTVVDIAVFNLVLALSIALAGEVLPVLAKIVSTVVSAAAAYLGHGFWTFRGRGGSRSNPWTISKFAIVTGAGLLMSVGIVGFSHYILEFQTVTQNNFANAIALVVSALVRFVATRHWVFRANTERHSTERG